MNMVSSDERKQAYFEGAESWAEDRLATFRGMLRIAWIVASVAAFVAVCEALALMMLMPLKRVEPYTLLVYRQTGYVQLLKPLKPQWITDRTALTQSFLAQYVIAREGFDIDSVQNDYRKVIALSSGSARADYMASMPASNPDSPLSRYPRSSTIDVAVKSITALSEHVALVRFETIRRNTGGQSAAGVPWMAVIRFDYADQRMSVANRLVNPLGFQVSRYRRSAEALVPAQASAVGVGPAEGVSNIIPSIRFPASPSGNHETYRQ